MANRFRILLHVMTTKRDIGSSYILAMLLEQLGCECFLAGTNTYLSRLTQLWKPHAVFYTTLHRANILKRTYPKAHLFYYSGEGGESYKFSCEKPLAEEKEIFDNIKRIYLWGNFAKGNILRRMRELKEKSFLFGHESILDEKCKVIGHPRLDIVRYFPKKEKKPNERIKIGLIGSFNMLNSITLGKRTTLSRVFDGASSEEVIFQSSLLHSYSKIVQTLDHNKYEINIRPYPLEDINQYLNSNWVKKGLLKVDKSLEFGVWALQQDLIIGPTSSTLSQIAMANRPFINLDLLNHRSNVAYEDSMRGIFIDHLSSHCPRTFDELWKMIDEYKQLSVKGKNINKLMHNVFNSNESGSCLWRVAKDIVNILKTDHPRINFWIPRNVIMKIQDFHFKENPFSYSHFSYPRLETQLKQELDPIVDNILMEIGSAKN